VATVEACRAALLRLAGELDRLDPQVRAAHFPRRQVICRISDLGVAFTARLDPDGLHDLVLLDPAPERTHADVRATVASDQLVALADGTDSFASAWLHRRIQISAPVRDLLRLRPLLSR
jgi:hypothetical protein